MFCSSRCSFVPFFVLRLLLPQSLLPIFNLIYAQLLFTVRGRSRVEGGGGMGGGAAHEESVQGDGGGGYRWWE